MIRECRLGCCRLGMSVNCFVCVCLYVCVRASFATIYVCVYVGVGLYALVCVRVCE